MPLPKSKALIIDDDLMLGSLFQSVLEMSGFDVTHLVESRNALQVIRSHRPDLVILDLFMPHVTGLDILQALRADSALAGLKVIVITGSEEAADDCTISELADMLLVKPVSLHQLVQLAETMTQPA